MDSRPLTKKQLDKKTATHIINIATTVLGSKVEALRWLRRPHPSLDNQTPWEVIKEETGAHRVEVLLRAA